MSAIALDPLIAEAKRRARRRYLLMLAALVVVAAAAVGSTYGLRSSSASLSGICATAPDGWKERTAHAALARPNVVLTNFRFGLMSEMWGLADDRLNWPANGVMVAVGNYGRAYASTKPGRLHVVRSEFGPFEGVRNNFAQININSHGRELIAWARVGAVTPATIAAANAALAGVRVCST